MTKVTNQSSVNFFLPVTINKFNVTEKGIAKVVSFLLSTKNLCKQNYIRIILVNPLKALKF